MKPIISTVLIVLVVCMSVGYLYRRHVLKQEDDAAYFALNAIHKTHDAAEDTCGKESHEHTTARNNACTVELKRKIKTGLYDRTELTLSSFDCIMGGAQNDLAELDRCFKNWKQRELADLEDWAVKYPRQAANLKRDALNEARKRDALRLKNAGHQLTDKDKCTDGRDDGGTLSCVEGIYKSPTK